MTTNTLSPAAAAPAPAPSRRVLDATTRMLHWLMALNFTGAYLTADGERWRLVHVSLGYTLAGLVVARLLWGLIGPRPVRLSVLWGKLQGLPKWFKNLTTVRSSSALSATWRPAQHLLMALAMALILALVAPLTLSGYAVWTEWGGEWLEEVHEFFGEALLWIVLLHIALIVLISLLRRKNQALPMLTGRVPGKGPDVAKNNHSVLATLVLACVLGFWAWQWQTAPQVPPQDAAYSREHHHDDD